VAAAIDVHGYCSRDAKQRICIDFPGRTWSIDPASVMYEKSSSYV